MAPPAFCHSAGFKGWVTDPDHNLGTDTLQPQLLLEFIQTDCCALAKCVDVLGRFCGPYNVEQDDIRPVETPQETADRFIRGFGEIDRTEDLCAEWLCRRILQVLSGFSS